MKETRPEILKLQAQNYKTATNSGGRLNYGTKTWIAGRDRTAQKVLIGGLGGLGVGCQWYNEREDHAEMPGYDDAPECDFAAEGEITRLFYENVADEVRQMQAIREN